MMRSFHPIALPLNLFYLNNFGPTAQISIKSGVIMLHYPLRKRKITPATPESTDPLSRQFSAILDGVFILFSLGLSACRTEIYPVNTQVLPLPTAATNPTTQLPDQTQGLEPGLLTPPSPLPSPTVTGVTIQNDYRGNPQIQVSGNNLGYVILMTVAPLGANSSSNSILCLLSHQGASSFQGSPLSSITNLLTSGFQINLTNARSSQSYAFDVFTLSASSSSPSSLQMKSSSSSPAFLQVNPSGNHATIISGSLPVTIPSSPPKLLVIGPDTLTASNALQIRDSDGNILLNLPDDGGIIPIGSTKTQTIELNGNVTLNSASSNLSSTTFTVGSQQQNNSAIIQGSLNLAGSPVTLPSPLYRLGVGYAPALSPTLGGRCGYHH